ncbi:MAG: endolytic transglycosylase MltG [Steroidobacteraceae bacterium]|nr:endolytic transglycosylase MltG [Steroidobacteraceae bacterium]
MSRLAISMRVVAGLATAAVLVLVGAWLAMERWLDAPVAIDEGAHRIEVPVGQPFSRTAQDLAARGFIDHPRIFAAYARLHGTDARVRAGEYEIQPGTSPRQLLALLESGAVVRRSITVVEGWTFRDLRRVLEEDTAIAQTLAGEDDAAVMAALGEPGVAAEGAFFPDTYLYDKGTTDLAILRKARERMRAELDAAWQSRAQDLPLANAYEALVLASIVEKETALASERARIAGVFIHRLRMGMRLQTDPTVIYGLGPGFDGNLRRSDLERDGPYNTYTREGLPPTPIGLPGAASLAAAVRPDERGETYFVATGLPDGSHEFSRTLAEHERAVARYLRRYRNRTTGH